MKLLEKILVAVDFSDSSDIMINMAIFVARKFNSQIILLHTIPFDVQESPVLTEGIIKNVKKSLNEINTKIKNNKIKIDKPIIKEGNPFDQIISTAEIYDVNVILMGSGNKSKEDGSQLGITAERVIRRSNKPVWIVQQSSAESIKNILCPVDFLDASARSLHNAINLARHFQAKLNILHIIPSPTGRYPFLPKINEQKKKIYIKQIHDKFDQFITQFDFFDVKCHKEIKEGKPDQEILNYAREYNSDLIVMGSVSKKYSYKTMLGYITEKIVRVMPCSVIAVKSESMIKLKQEEIISNIQEHFNQGNDLLKKGFPKEAIDHFEKCISYDSMFAPAWEGLSIAHQRLHHDEKSIEFKKQADYIRKNLWQIKVEAEAKNFKWGKRWK